MDKIILRGGSALRGEVRVQGAKNSVLPILAATVLSSGESIIHNCPNLTDVEASLNILTHLGCRVRREGNTVTVDAGGISRSDIPEELMHEMRSSIIFMGAVAARCARADMTYPGGCELGSRPVDMHIAALRRLGYTLREDGVTISCSAGETRGGDVYLPFPSVGATENIMLAAARCRGVTRIHNAAREPEIEDLAALLRIMGMRVAGNGTKLIELESPGALRGAEFTVMPDRMAAATYMACACSAGGRVCLKSVVPAHFGTVSRALEAAGCTVLEGDSEVTIERRGELISPGSIVTAPYPAFPTDAQAPVMAALLRARGETYFEENIFERRFRHVPELRKLGGDITVSGRTAVVRGVGELRGAHLEATDLRGGAALVVGALAARGESVITELRHIDRGYESLTEDLSALGADIERI